MALSVGSKLGEYEVVGHLGSGGMGDVYRARDTRLGREVALKVVRDLHAEDPARVSRLRREARLLASLSHPNIATIHDVLEEGGVLCLVLELVEGPTLAERLAQGPLDVAEALHVAAQLAAGLEAAHEAGIIHRDIKPSNLKLRADGRLTILDFGVGKAASAIRGEAGAATLDATHQAGFLGTPGYMSPEQARGQDVDRRADAWAFGCVLFECLSACKAFGGDTPTDRMAASLASEVDWQALPETTPERVVRLLERCLEKDATRRLRDLRDARLEIEACAGAASPSGRRAELPGARRARRARLSWASATVAVAALSAAVAWFARGSAPPPLPRPGRFELALPQSTRLAPEPGCLDVSRDGRHVVSWVADWRGTSRPGLAVRGLGSPDWGFLYDVADATHVAFSPDASSLTLMGSSSVWTVSSSGGAPRRLAPAAAPVGIAWGEDAWIYYAPTRASEIWRVAADGGEPVPLTTLRGAEGEISHRWPRLAPDGRHLAYTVKTSDIATFDEAVVRLHDLVTGEDRELVAGGTFGTITVSGHLVFARSGALRAVPLDAGLRVAGPSVEVQRVRMDATTGSADFALSEEGTLAFVDGSFGRDTQPEIVRRDGTVTPIGPRGPWATPDVSPDGRRVVVTVMGANDQIWLLDLQDGRSVPLTRGGGNRHGPRWFPDGEHVAYHLDAPGRAGFYMTDVRGSGVETLILAEQEQAQSFPGMDVMPDGSALVVTRKGADGDLELVRVPLDGGPVSVMVDRAGPQHFPRLSPDGRWLAFAEPEGLRVVSMQGPGPTLPASQGFRSGMASPAWANGGRTLCFASDGGLVAVPVPADAAVDRLLPSEPFVPGEWGSFEDWDALPDGSGVVRLRHVEAAPPSPWVNVRTEFLAELERLAPHPR